MTKQSVANLINHLSSKGFGSLKDFYDFATKEQKEVELALYLKVLSGLGVLLSLLFFIGLIIIVDYQSKIGFIIWGILFILVASIIYKFVKIKNILLFQTSFVLIIFGKFCFVYGVSNIFNNSWIISLGLLFITATTYYIYRLSIEHFLSFFAILFSILINILWSQNVIVSRELMLNGFFLFQLIATTILLTNGKVKYELVPLSYAFIFSICINVLFLASYIELNDWEINLTFINISLVIWVIVLFSWVVGGVAQLKKAPLIVASLGVIFLGLISASGILLTIYLVVLGYAKQERLIIIIGIILIPVFLFLYYYNLDISLIQKSGILIGSGVIMIIGRFYLLYKGWDKGGEKCIEK